MATNHSRPVKFDPGTLVMYNGKVWEVDHNSGIDSCHIKDQAHPEAIEVPERFLRTLTRWEYIYHRDPMTGKMMVGANPAWAFWYGLVIGSLCSYAAFHWGASSKVWEVAGSLPLALLLTWYLIGTVRNSKGKQS